MWLSKLSLYIALQTISVSAVFAIDLSLPKDLLTLQEEGLTRTSNEENIVDFPQQFYDQLVDHKTISTFKQRYYVNDNHYKEGGPAFLMIGGEGQNRPSSVSRSFASELARRHGGIVYGLEHRYYGVSHPFNNTSAYSLRYLSSDYALKDIARFAKNIINPKTGKTNNKWYAFGYSYSGMLAAWARKRYPTLFHGALASSAPVQAKEDFYKYDQVIGAALGSECSNKMEVIVKKIDIIKNNVTLFKNLKNKTNCNRIDDNHFLYTLYDVISHAVQYNKPGGKVSIDSLCSSLSAKTSDELVYQFIETINGFFSSLNETCDSFSGIDNLQNEVVKKDSAFRQWTYQCCTEFGFWQTAPRNAKSMRSKFLTVSWFNQYFCSNKFFSSNIGPPNTIKINNEHLGNKINTKRIIFTNGDKDPWTALSVFNTSLSRPDRPVIMIKGGSHSNDYLAPSPSNSQSLSYAYKQTFETFESWLK